MASSQPDLPADEAIAAVLRAFARERAGRGTFCPAEAARRLDPADWRALMPRVRAVAQRLVAAGELACTQQGRAVNPVKARGPIRLAARVSD